MISLSDRLQMIADEIKTGETMADIGTDHGFLPIYLLQKNISPFVIMGDISAPTLEKTKENVKINLEDYAADSSEEVYCTCRVGNGFEILSPGEVDSVVIAGMGAAEMCDIIGKNPEKSASFSKMILQPRKDVGLLRYFLCNNGFTVVRENLVRERKYICEILTIKPGKDNLFIQKMRDVDKNSIKWEIPYYYREFVINGDALAIELIKRKISREKMIINSKSNSNNADDSQNRENIKYLERILGKYEI